MADFPGESVPPANETSVADDSATDPGAEGDHQHVVVSAARADAPLGECRTVGVVVDRHDSPETGFESSSNLEVLDVGQIG